MIEPKEKVLIELDKDQLKYIICKHFGIIEPSASISISYYAGDQREPEYYNVVVKGDKNV